MTFPRTPLPMGVELYYSGAWHDISPDVSDEGITITRGRSAEGKQADPSTMSLTLKNSGGTYSPRNPTSPLYGLVGRNTPIRAWVELGALVSGSNRHYRFWGEVTEWPQKWGLKGAQTVHSPIECSGVTRRLSQGASPVRSSMYRFCSSLPNAVAYWPLEDRAGVTSMAAAKGNARRAAVVGEPKNAAYSGLDASGPLMTLESGRVTCYPPVYTPQAQGRSSVRFVTFLPSSTTTGSVIVRLKCSGAVVGLDVVYSATGQLDMNCYDNAGDQVTSVTGDGSLSYAGLNDQPVRISIETWEPNAAINTWFFINVYSGVGLASTNAASYDLRAGRITSVDFNPTRANLSGVAIGHVTVENLLLAQYPISASLRAYDRETGLARIARLCTENGVSLSTIGGAGGSAAMGTQRPLTLLELFREVSDTDGGALYEPRDGFDLTYRTLESMYAQAPGAAIAYTDNLLIPFEPVDDDQAIRNRVSVTRRNGAESTVEATTGPLSVLAPPNGVGVYDEGVELSLASDQQAKHQAGWRVHLGTLDEARYPRIGVDLAHPVFLADANLTRDLLTLDIGDRLDVTGLPAWLPPDPVQQIVQGYTEQIEPFDYRITFNCTPARPYRAAYFNTATDRYSNDNTVLAGTMTTTSTSRTVNIPAGPLWTTSGADLPFDVLVAGERMTVTAVSGSSSPQTFTVTRSVNGVVKSHAAGEAVTLYDSTFYGL